MFILYALVIGLAVGFLVRGRPAGLAQLQFRWPWVMLGGLLVQVLLFSEVFSSRIGAAGQAAQDDIVQAQLAPQPVQGMRAAHRPRRRDRQLARPRRRQRLRGVQQPRQGRDQAPDLVLVDLVLAAEVVQDPRARPLRLRIPLVVGQLQVADRPGTGGPHGRLHVGHAPEATGPRPLGQIRSFPLVVFPYLAAQRNVINQTVSLGSFAFSR